jgi:hypothetical protein
MACASSSLAGMKVLTPKFKSIFFSFLSRCNLCNKSRFSAYTVFSSIQSIKIAHNLFVIFL